MFNKRECSVGQGRSGCRERTVWSSQLRAWSSPARIFSSNFYRNCCPYFENLRIPLDNAKILQQLASLADEIIRLKKELVNSNKTQVPEPAEGPTEATQKQIADLETQVNTLVYQLYGITDTEEIEVVEKRQRIVC